MLFDSLHAETELVRAECVGALRAHGATLRTPVPIVRLDWPPELVTRFDRHRRLAGRHEQGRLAARTRRDDRLERLMHSALADCAERLAAHDPRGAYLGFVFAVETCRLGAGDSVSAYIERLSLRRLFASMEPHVEDEGAVRGYAFVTIDLLRHCVAAGRVILRGLETGAVAPALRRGPASSTAK